MSHREARVYLSGVETDLGEAAKRLVCGLDRAGFETFWSPIRAGGPRAIGREINASNGVLALVNGTWATSTYHSMEITFALGELGYEGQPPLRTPCPVMAYVEERESRFVRDHWIQTRIEAGEVVVLPSDPEQAVARANAMLTSAA